MLAAAFMVLAGCSAQGELMPLEPTSTPQPSFVINPIKVSFNELQTDPQSYQNEVIQVTGNYQRLPLPDCIPNGGPDARWALVSENLRLDVVGFDALLNLVREPATFTLNGIFRLYEAPLGCGKEPAVGTAWFLEALTLVEPNPVNFGRPMGEVFDLIGDIPDFPTRTPLPVMTATPEQAVTAIPTPTDQLPTLMPTTTVLTTMTPEGSATPTISGSATGTTTVVPTATNLTTTATATPTPTSLTPTVIGSTTPTLTPAPGDTAVPLPTATTGEGGGGYPPPPNPYP